MLFLSPKGGVQAGHADAHGSRQIIHPGAFIAMFPEGKHGPLQRLLTVEALFLAALDHYQRHRGQYTASSMEGKGTARQAFETLFEVAALELTRPNQPKGCMLALALPTCSPDIESLRGRMNQRRGRSLERFVKRLKAAVGNGELPAATNAAALAQFFMTTLQGMSIQERTGASRQQLLEVGRLAMKVWPAEAEGVRSV